MKRYLLVALGGALGSTLRYFLGFTLSERFGARFPLATLLINVSACFLIGLSLEYLNRHLEFSPAWRFLVPVGFIGGYSTFSTFEWEAWANFSNGAYWFGIGYIAASVVGGLVAVSAGAAVGRIVP